MDNLDLDDKTLTMLYTLSELTGNTNIPCKSLLTNGMTPLRRCGRIDKAKASRHFVSPATCITTSLFLKF